MCRVAMSHTRRHYVTSCELRERVGVCEIEMYVYRRQLQWLGHASRMDYDRLPR